MVLSLCEARQGPRQHLDKVVALMIAVVTSFLSPFIVIFQNETFKEVVEDTTKRILLRGSHR